MKALILCTSILFFSFVSVSQERLKFTRSKAMPNAMMGFGYSQSQDRIFVMGGATEVNRFNSRLHIYNKKLNQWLDLPMKDLPRTKYSTAIYLKKYNGLLLLGGIEQNGNNTVIVKDVSMIQLGRFNVKSLGELPTASKKMGAAYWADKVYFFGGSTSMEFNNSGVQSFSYTNQLKSYDLETGDIVDLPDLPKAMETNGGIVNGELFTFGGFSGSALPDVWKYNIKNKSWTELAPLDSYLSGYALARYKSYFFIVGDFHNTDQLIVYDTKKQIPYYFKMNIRGRHMGASIVGEELHVYGGTDGAIPSYRHHKISVNEILNRIPDMETSSSDGE